MCRATVGLRMGSACEVGSFYRQLVAWLVCRNDVAEAVTMVCGASPWVFCELSAEVHLPRRCVSGRRHGGSGEKKFWLN